MIKITASVYNIFFVLFVCLFTDSTSSFFGLLRPSQARQLSAISARLRGRSSWTDQVLMIFRPAGRFLTIPFPPGPLAALFFAAVMRPPLLFFSICFSFFCVVSLNRDTRALRNRHGIGVHSDCSDACHGAAKEGCTLSPRHGFV